MRKKANYQRAKRDKNINERIRMEIVERRAKMDVTQAELARLIGSKTTQVCDWEYGKSIPRIGRIIALAKAFGCAVADMTGTP